MKELDFLQIISQTLSRNSHIGDDCAYLRELGIVVTQDSLVEGVHFSREFASPYQIASKAIMVNLSDIFASGAIPKYFTISLSLPKDVDESFVKEFYKACEDASSEYDFEVVGGDLTGSEKIFISICAIGMAKGRRISSRRNAKLGDYVITTGVHGSSAAGLWLLSKTEKVKNEKKDFFSLIDSHLAPIPRGRLSQEIATKIDCAYAMMDTSDGLMDALFKIAQASNVQITVEYDKIPYDKEIEEVAKLANVDFNDWIFYGGEDFQLVACIDEENLKKISAPYAVVGRVESKTEKHFVQIVNYPPPQTALPEHEGETMIRKIYDLEKTYNHFKGGA